MTKLLWGFLGLALIAAPSRGDEKKTDEKKAEEKKPATPQPGTRQRSGAVQFGRTQPLLSEKDMEELKLSAAQKEKVGKIVKDYEAKAKEAVEQRRNLFQGGQFDREKLRAAQEASTTARTAAEDKIKTELNDEQKKKFDEQKQNRARNAFNRGAFGRLGSPFKPGQVLPGASKERLELNEEQKKKIEELEKEVKGKLEKILNADQLKKLEQPTQPRRPRNDQQ